MIETCPIKTPIHDFLRNYAESSPVRCHMPGGKTEPFDITEIEGADSLFECEGIIKESEEIAASLFGAGKTLYSCGGSTLSIQTMLALAKAENPQKKRVVASRFCHKSLVSSCVLLGLEIDWIEPASFLSCEVAPNSVEDAISDAALCVFLQGIDYYGGECDIAPVSRICKRHGIPLLVDNAHGAYKVFTHDHPLSSGADLVADSAHKTLPCLTGGAYLHIAPDAPEIFFRRSKELMALFGSSSPSYLILNSLDLCNKHIALEKDRAEKVMCEIAKLKEELSRMGYCLRDSDKMRITVDAAEYGYGGDGLCELLAEKGIVCEYADQKYTVLLFSTAQPMSDFSEISAAFAKIPPKPPLKTSPMSVFTSKKAIPMREAVFSPHIKIPTKKAAGMVCGSIDAPCPPCVPIVMPGEVFTESAIDSLISWGVKEVSAVAK